MAFAGRFQRLHQEALQPRRGLSPPPRIHPPLPGPFNCHPILRRCTSARDRDLLVAARAAGADSPAARAAGGAGGDAAPPPRRVDDGDRGGAVERAAGPGAKGAREPTERGGGGDRPEVPATGALSQTCGQVTPAVPAARPFSPASAAVPGRPGGQWRRGSRGQKRPVPAGRGGGESRSRERRSGAEANGADAPVKDGRWERERT